MRLFMLWVLLSAFAVPLLSQTVEYGTPNDLRGLTKYYVDTNGNLKDRERIVNEIEKANAGLALVDDPDDAEMILVFGGGKEEKVVGATSQPIYGTTMATTNINRRKFRVGAGAVYVKGKSKDVPRVVMNFESTQDKIGENKPSTKFAKQFIKAYRQVNGLKD